MSTETEKYWKIVIDQLRTEGKFHSLSVEDAEMEYEAAIDDPIPQDIRNSIIERIMNKQKGAETGHLPTPPNLYIANQINVNNTSFAHLNRNKGDDPEAENLLKKLREDALSEDENDGD